jgi:hypothetical protein
MVAVEGRLTVTGEPGTVLARYVVQEAVKGADV